MSRKTVIEGIGIAALLSIVAFPMMVLGTTVMYPSIALRLCISAIGFLYILYILAKTSTRIGRGTVGALSALAIAALLFFNPSFVFFALALTALIWIVRSLYNYQSVVFTLADGVLCAISLASAAWGFMLSHSIMVALWCYFLVQALTAAIPRSFEAVAAMKNRTAGHGKPSQDRFSEAQRAAQEALRQLV